MTFKKTLGPNGTAITMVSWKAGSREVLPRSLAGLLFFRLLGRKGGPKGVFLKTMKTKNCQKTHVHKSSALGPSKKRSWGAVLKQIWKSKKKRSGNQWVLMVRYHWKVLKNKQFSWFLVIPQNDETTMPQGISKVIYFSNQNEDMGLPGSTYPPILDVLGRCQKIIIFGRPPDGPTNRKNWAVERQRVEKVTSSIRRRQVSGREGSPGTTENRTLWSLDHPQRIPTRHWAEGPANIWMNKK